MIENTFAPPTPPNVLEGGPGSPSYRSGELASRGKFGAADLPEVPVTDPALRA